MTTDTLGRDAAALLADDPDFNRPVVEVNELRDGPQAHRYVHGRFEGTEARFSLYFPPEKKYEGRFHHNTYPLATSADIGPFPIAFDVASGNLGFTLESGAYYVQANGGGAFSRSARDYTVAAYRVNAAAARFSRVVAAQLYGEHRPYGYLYGGSGGAYQTMGGAEHTEGVWDGFMPFVLGVNNAVPSFFSARMHALQTLKRRGRFAGVMDALNPGGGGDIYAGLDEEERAALHEVTLMGFPPRGWYAHETQGSGYFSDIQGGIPPLDPAYLEDFWTKPGYAGADNTAKIHAERFGFDTFVAGAVDGAPRTIALEAVPERSIVDAHVVLKSGPLAGRSLAIASVVGRAVTFSTASDPAVVAAMRAGEPVRIDNSWALALQTYQRHQVPPDAAEYAWDQFRDAGGKPLYPQRDLLIGHVFARSAVGDILRGRFTGKMLLVQALMDIDAFPWSADWYRSLVKKEMGPAADNFALWFIDHAQHENPLTPLARAHAVRLDLALQRGLHDLARWVEKGERPSETRYRVEDSQVIVPASARERGGPQAVPELKANGGVRAEVRVGEPVSFTASAEVPPGQGLVVGADWDFEGRGQFTAHEGLGAPAERVEITARHAYAAPGTYFPVLRVHSHRDGDAQTPYARVQNIARARVVVT
jgi:hypothetical protein